MTALPLPLRALLFVALAVELARFVVRAHRPPPKRLPDSNSHPIHYRSN
jgi:hypothetical protein